MFYHDWVLMRALMIFVITCSFLLVRALLELRSRRRRDAGDGANLSGESVQRATTSAPAGAYARPAPEAQPTAAEKRVRPAQPVAAQSARGLVRTAPNRNRIARTAEGRAAAPVSRVSLPDAREQ